jgi:hypothetical protein
MKAHRILRRRGFHIFYTIGSQMAVRLSAPRAGRLLHPRKIHGTHSVRGWVDPRAIVRLEWLGQLKNPTTSSGIEPATFRACTIVPQPTKLPRAWKPYILSIDLIVQSWWARSLSMILWGILTVRDRVSREISCKEQRRNYIMMLCGNKICVADVVTNQGSLYWSHLPWYLEKIRFTQTGNCEILGTSLVSL